jgi:hypothetical protein
MATTDARSGFRLPWSADERSTEDEAANDMPDAEATAETDAPADAGGSSVASRAPARASATAPAPTGARKQSKFLADLTRAMQAAAESAREETMARLQADAKGWVEEIHNRSAGGATDLRRRADDEVAAIREWSKAEMARIREETDTRIAGRKQRLETEIEDHAAGIERRIEAVQGRVASFESEMAAFFERLLAEDDPGRFAALAENMPEPPPFDDIEVDAADPAIAELAVVDADAAPSLGAAALPDFAAAEAEALAGVDADDDGDIPVLADDELNARLAHLMPATAAPAGESTRTSVIVTGLVSVASIAGFKRHLARLGGVQSVAVSSGPEGDFIFSVTHHDGAELRDAIPGLPGFRARVTGGSDDVIEVSARDPDPES